MSKSTIINSFVFSNNETWREALTQFVKTECERNTFNNDNEAKQVLQADLIANTVNNDSLQSESIKRLTVKTLVKVYSLA